MESTMGMGATLGMRLPISLWFQPVKRRRMAKKEMEMEMMMLVGEKREL